MAKLKTGRHTGALRALRRSERISARHRGVKRSVRDLTKEFQSVIQRKEKDRASEMLPKLYSAWDKAAKKGVIHWKAAARKKARLTHKFQTLSAASA